MTATHTTPHRPTAWEHIDRIHAHDCFGNAGVITTTTGAVYVSDCYQDPALRWSRVGTLQRGRMEFDLAAAGTTNRIRFVTTGEEVSK